MTKLERAVNQLINGETKAWYFDFEIADVSIQGGYFYRRADARRLCKTKLRKVIVDDSVLVDYLTLKFT